MPKETSFERELGKYALQTASRVAGFDYLHKAWDRCRNYSPFVRVIEGTFWGVTGIVLPATSRLVHTITPSEENLNLGMATLLASLVSDIGTDIAIISSSSDLGDVAFKKAVHNIAVSTGVDMVRPLLEHVKGAPLRVPI